MVVIAPHIPRHLRADFSHVYSGIHLTAAVMDGCIGEHGERRVYCTPQVLVFLLYSWLSLQPYHQPWAPRKRVYISFYLNCVGYGV